MLSQFEVKGVVLLYAADFTSVVIDACPFLSYVEIVIIVIY